MRRLKILTWHTHGAYLLYLTQAPHDFFVLSKPGHPPGYGGRSGHLPWGANVHDLPLEEARNREFDCIVFQDDPHYLEDQHRYLTGAQQRLPKIYVEHDPPRANPVDTVHPVSDRNVLVVHVTHFNRLMWDNGGVPTRVIEHGVLDPGYRYTGEIAKGLVVINNLRTRGRRLGWDLFRDARGSVPLDLVGMGAQEAGGLGEIRHADLPAFAAKYRFLFNPIRYTSMGLAVIEAMMAGLPIVALATTEMATVIRTGANGFAETSMEALVAGMEHLLASAPDARILGLGARNTALERFGIGRFVADWNRAFEDVTDRRITRRGPGSAALRPGARTPTATGSPPT